MYPRQLARALALASVLTSPLAFAQIRGASCNPNGAGMTPPVTTDAWVGAGVSCDLATGHTYFLGWYEELAGGSLSARLHGPADPGQDGPLIVEVALDGAVAGGWDHQLDLDAALVDDLLAGRGYIVVTTSAYPGGEARAQIEPYTRIFVVEFSGAEMVPPIDTPAGGFVSLHVTPSSGQVSAAGWFGGLTGEPTRMSLHAPAWYGETAPEVLGVDFVPNVGLVLEGTLAPDLIEHVLAGRGYLVVHSDGYPDGELRAQSVQIGGAIGTAFCPGSLNSLGVAGTLFAEGSPIVASGELTLSTGPLPPNQWGYFLVGSGSVASMPAGSSGRLCLNGGVIGRYANQVQNTGETPGGWGAIALSVDFASLPIAGGMPIQPGDTWNFQAWHRDVVDGAPTSNFTRAVSIDFL